MDPVAEHPASARVGLAVGSYALAVAALAAELADPAPADARDQHSVARADVMVDVAPDGFLTVTVTNDRTGIPSEGRRSGLRNLAGRARYGP